MKNIEVKVLNEDTILQAEKMMVCAARLTQRGHKIKNMDDFMKLYEKPYKESTVANMVALPHPTIQKFGVITVAIVGASRRFLAQITRHQNEVKFMSASLQYSDYSGEADFAIPYHLLNNPKEYLEQCVNSMKTYQELVGLSDNDSAGYAAPQGLRNILIISATPYQWKHMIKQRICRRNTDETRIVMLKIWQELYKYGMFRDAFPNCCEEKGFSCGRFMSKKDTPESILRQDYPLLFEENSINWREVLEEHCIDF